MYFDKLVRLARGGVLKRKARSAIKRGEKRLIRSCFTSMMASEPRLSSFFSPKKTRSVSIVIRSFNAVETKVMRLKVLLIASIFPPSYA